MGLGHFYFNHYFIKGEPRSWAVALCAKAALPVATLRPYPSLLQAEQHQPLQASTSMESPVVVNAMPNGTRAVSQALTEAQMH